MAVSISLSTKSSDDYFSIEKTYTFTSVYRRLIVGGIDTLQRGLIRNGSITDVGEVKDETCLPIDATDITYFRVTNLRGSYKLYISLFNTESAGITVLSIDAGESLQLHSELTVDDAGTPDEIDWVGIQSFNVNGMADIFIGFE